MIVGDTGGQKAFAFCFGYIQALLQQCGRRRESQLHLGTAMPWRIRSITSATESPSISNSGRRMIRCSNTGTAIALMSSGVTKSRAWIAGVGAAG
jgi:hypothetical protein